MRFWYQTCTGRTGTFTLKPKNIKTKKINCLFSKKKAFKKKSKDELPLLKYTLKNDNKTKIEPNKVYKKN